MADEKFTHEPIFIITFLIDNLLTVNLEGYTIRNISNIMKKVVTTAFSLIFFLFLLLLATQVFKESLRNPVVLAASQLTPTTNVLILSDSQQVSLPGTAMPSAGNGMVAVNGTTARRLSVTGNNLDGVGGANGTSFRAYVEWDTSSIPKNLNIQAVGVYLYDVAGYGAGNTVKVTKLINPVNSYPNNNSGNLQLYSDLSTSSAYLSGWSSLSTTGGKILPIGSSVSSPNAVNDLINRMSQGLPFGVGLVGSNETNAYTEWYSRQDTTSPNLHPALVIFYNGTIGQQMGMIRSLRTGFWDGSHYWQFFTGQGGQYYAYSSDGSNWTMAGRLDTDANRHFGVWYDGAGNVWAAYSHLHQGFSVNNDDLLLTKGTISGTSISWSAPATVFASSTTSGGSTTIDGYDFPGIVKDSNQNCFVVARHYNGTNTTVKSGVEIKESTDPTCSSFGASTVLIDYNTSVGSVHAHGGYVVPLTNGKVYVVYKSTDGTYGQIYGRLFDGTSWQPQETIVSSTVMGIYIQGFSIVANGDTVHLVYIGSDGSVQYENRTTQWNSPVTLDNSTVFYTPAISLDTSTGNLYVFYRSAGKNDSANAGVFYKVGQNPFQGANWSAVQTVTNTSWTPNSMMQGDAFWELSSNYSGSSTIFVTYIDGAYGLKTVVVPPAP